MRQRLTKLATILGVGVLFVAAFAWAQGAASQPVVAAPSPFWTWLKANWPALCGVVAGVLLNLAVALTQFPQTTGAVAWLKKLAAFFSFLQHLDSYGTLKWPFTPCNPPVSKPSAVAKAPTAPTAVALLLVLPLALGSTGCCLLKGNCSTNPTVNQLIDCAKTELSQATIDLVNNIIILAKGGDPNWSAELTKLEQQGTAAVVCAVALAEQLLEGLVNPTSPSPAFKRIAIKTTALAGVTPTQALLGALRLNAYLAQTHRTVTNVPAVPAAP
jgi:hypothetical protein